MYLILAWRNMWRSRRRTAITVSSIFFAVLFAILMRTLALGVMEKMIDDTASLTGGYLQIHHKGYWDNKTPDSSFAQDPALTAILQRDPSISAWAPRLESFALASSGNRTRGIMVTGIDPRRENTVSRLAGKIVAGRYLSGPDKGIMLTEGLAGYLKLGLGDTVVLLGNGYEGGMAAGKYRIEAIVRTGIPQADKSMAWLPMQADQDLLGTGPRYTSITIMTADRARLESIQKDILRQTSGRDYEVMTWQEMMPELDQYFRGKMAQNAIVSGILYLVIAFGLFGTILMMLNERKHEFGILVAIGMKKYLLSLLVMLELVLMSLVGAVLGIIAAFPLVYFFKLHPIGLRGNVAQMMERFNMQPVIVPSTDPSHFLLQGYIVLIIALVLSLFVPYTIHKLKVIQAINS